MRLRLILPLALLAVASLVAPACSGDDEGDSAARTSEERESTDDGGAGGSDSGGDSGTSGDSGSEESDGPDLGDITESVPGLENLGDCFDLATAYSSLYLQALSGDAAEAQQKAEELKDQLPEELHDELDVVAAAIGEVAEEGPLGGSSALSTPEYQEADTAITDYLQQECGG